MEFVTVMKADNTEKCFKNVGTAAFFAILFGSFAGYFAANNGYLAAFEHSSLGCILLVVVAITFGLVVLSGFCILGMPLVFLLNSLFGAFLTALSYICLCDVESFSFEWFLWAFVLFATVLADFIVSAISCRLSAFIVSRVAPDLMFKRRVTKYICGCMFVILTIFFVFALVNRLYSEFFI